MRVHQDIAALRSDRASQRLARSSINRVVAQWQAAQQTRNVARDLALFGSGADVKECKFLRRMLQSEAPARDWLDPLLDAILTTLRDNPLAEVPLNGQSSESYTTLRLLAAGEATLSLCVYWPVEIVREPANAVFNDHESHEVILSGRAKGAVLDIDQHALSAKICKKEYTWKEGDTIKLDYMRTRFLHAIDRPVLTLHVARTPTDAKPTHQYCVETGERIHSASGNKRSSRLQMAVALLGALEHEPALPELEELASDHSADVDLRWEALRQCLALDSGIGFSVLSKVSQDVSDPLVGPATALRRTLISTYPQLAAQAA